jgi:hypothetical protein
VLLENISRALYLLLSLVIGLRLLWLYRSSRQLPELLMAICLLSEGVLYNSSRWIATAFEGPWTENPDLVEGAVRPLLVLSSLSVAVFAWKTSRPHARWAPILVAVLGLPMVVFIIDGFRLGSDLLGPFSSAGLVVRGAFLGCYLWAAVETLLYYRNARRRRRVGLEADPLITNRAFFLSVSFWSFVAFWMVVMSFTVLRQIWGVNFSAQWILGVTGTIRVVGLWLAFLPPRFFTERLVAAATARGGSR